MTTTAIPVWPPRSEADIRRAVGNGILEETHVLDLKRELGAGTGANRDLAKDLAAFAVDGGDIVIGVGETATGIELSPVPLAGLSERLEQIARMKVREPLSIETTQIPTDSDPSIGYLVVRVPASARAPHMVDGKYYGRGDKTNYVMDHAEVLRHHQRLLAAAKNASEVAHRVREQSPIDPDEGLLCLAAVPVGASRDLLLDLASSSDWKTRAYELFASAWTDPKTDYAWSIREALNPRRRPQGIALAKGLDLARKPDGQSLVVECFLGEDGRIEFLSEGVHGDVALQGVQPPRPYRKGVFEFVIAGATLYVATLAGRAAEVSGYRGPWSLAVLVADLADGWSWIRNVSNTWPDGVGAVFTADTYERATAASSTELIQNPAHVAGDLVLPLLRSLDSDWHDKWAYLKRLG